MDPLTAVQSYWKAVGVDAALNPYPRVQYVALRNQGWTNGYLDMNNLVIPMYISVIPKLLPAEYNTPLLVSTQKPPGYAEAIAQAVATRDFKLLKTRTQAVVKILYDNATVLPLYSLCDPIAMDKTVHDSGLGGFISAYLWTPEKVWLSK
jgi:ABC-type transport system substrate-binding protein